MDQNVLDVVKKKKPIGHRKVGMKPLCSYNISDWAKYYRKSYIEKIGEKYSGNFNQTLRILRLLIYPIVFYELKWSAIEFASFIDQKIDETKDGGFIASLNMFQYNKEFARFLVDKADKEFKKRRVDSFFESLIYIPFFSISSTQDDLELIFKQIKDKKCAFIYNYGIPCFCRYLEESQNISFKEAVKQTKVEMAKILKVVKKREPLLLKRILVGFAKSSLLWEPYFLPNPKKRIQNESNILDWRNEMGKLWDAFSIREMKWWRTKSEMEDQSMITPIKKFFKENS